MYHEATVSQQPWCMVVDSSCVRFVFCGFRARVISSFGLQYKIMCSFLRRSNLFVTRYAGLKFKQCHFGHEKAGPNEQQQQRLTCDESLFFVALELFVFLSFISCYSLELHTLVHAYLS